MTPPPSPPSEFFRKFIQIGGPNFPYSLIVHSVIYGNCCIGLFVLELHEMCVSCSCIDSG